MNEAAKVKQTGRLIYVEPTVPQNFRDADFQGTIDTSILFPYEDYGLAVDLIIETQNRYSCGSAEFTNEKSKMAFSTKNGTISFLGGTDGVLTTNYTDIDMKNPDKNTQECIGIESINISYQSWFFPQVVIKFLDVRGATIMAPAEKAYYKKGNTTEMKNVSKLYQSFFTYPYPIFTLKVKGFYGKGVTYKLCCQKTSIEMDGQTGNFVITANFVGYMFGIYADLPMSLLSIAPFTEEGKAYWQSKIDDNVYYFEDRNGNQQSAFMTIPTLKKTMMLAAENPDVRNAAAASQQVLDSFNEAKANLEQIRVLNENFKAHARVFKSTKRNYENGPNKGKSIRITIFKDSDFAENLITFQSFFDENKQNGIIDDAELEKFKEDNNYLRISAVKKEGKLEVTLLHNYLTKALGNSWSIINRYDKAMVRDIANYILDGSTSEASAFGLDVDLSEINVMINERLEEIRRETDKKYKEYKEKENDVIEKALGFRPSIKNIYRLMFAHMDTFIHCFYSYVDGIKDKLDASNENDRKKRKKSYFEIKDGDTDTENADNSSDWAVGNYLPPFPGFYRTRDVDKAKELYWPGGGNLKNGDELEEVQMVYDFLAASQEYGEAMESANNASGAITTRGELATNVHDFIPLTPTDFVYGATYGNPYAGIKNGVIKGSPSIGGDVIFKFALRAFYFIYFISAKVYAQDAENEQDYSTLFRKWIIDLSRLITSNSHDKGLYFKISKFAEMFGEIEALNFEKAVGDKTSLPLQRLIGRLGDGENNTSDYRTFCKTIAPNSKSKTEGNPEWSAVWHWDGNNTKDNLFLEEGSDDKAQLSYNLWHDPEEMYFPTNVSNINKIKDDYATSNLEYNPSYLTPNVDGKINGDGLKFEYDKPLGRSTILVISDGNYFAKFSDAVKKAYAEKEKSDDEDNVKKDESAEEQEKNKTLRSHVIERYDEMLTNVETKRFVEYESGVISDGDFESAIKDEEKKTECFIKYPTSVCDEIHASYFGKYNNGQSLHALNKDNILADAFLFLQCTPFSAKEKMSSNYYLDLRDYVPILKSQLLREGSFYWRQDVMDANNGVDPIKLPEGYVNPSSTQGFNGDTAWDKEDSLKLREGRPKAYRPWHGTTSLERRAVLKQMFIRWAEDSYGKVRSFLSNPSYYVPASLFNVLDDLRTTTTTEYYGGLNEKLLTGEEGTAVQQRHMQEIQEFLQDCFLTTCVVFPFGFYADKPKIITNLMTAAFKGFMDGLRRIYGVQLDEDKENSLTAAKKQLAKIAQDPFKNDDIRLSLYMTLKSLYDKWLCSPYEGRKRWEMVGEDEGSLVSGKSDFSNFRYVDSFYNDIGNVFNVGLTGILNWLESNLPTTQLYVQENNMGYMGKSLLEFMADVAESCGSMLFALPQKFGLDGFDVQKLFKPIPAADVYEWDSEASSFVFMYTYKPSEHLGAEEKSDVDMNGWSREGDGIDLTDEEVNGILFENATGRNQNYTIPAFGVTYAKQNQSIFKSVGLTNENNGVTEPALRATFDIASREKENGARQTTFFGQDLYRVYSQYSYLCSVEMMGNMQIMPMMYFQLNNVPLWRGAYMIIKVDHTITAGDITTKIVGQRINKFAIPLANAEMVISRDLSSSGTTGVNNGPGVNTSYSNNEAGNAIFIGRQEGNENVALPSDFDVPLDKITEKNPVFVFTQAHGTTEEKREESIWSRALIENYVVPKLKSKGLNVYIGNKKGEIYNMTDARKIADHLGSEKVVSIVPHWNAACGKRYLVFYGQDGGNTYKIHAKSKYLADCFISAANETKNKATEYTKIPNGAMAGDVRASSSLVSERVTAKDGALLWGYKKGTTVVPPALLLENWYADYPDPAVPESEIKRNKDGLPAVEADSTNKDIRVGDRYGIMGYWLRDTEGYEAISDMIVKGCLNYIKWLGEDGGKLNNMVCANCNYDG